MARINDSGDKIFLSHIQYIVSIEARGVRASMVRGVQQVRVAYAKGRLAACSGLARPMS
uniref:Uncharacterized protein n=1 Tax=Setaria italica TaxID=4555 RepID=K4AHV3_SETIT